ncbi:hypothetical protein [Flavobacterium sp. N1719]|uniref:hypothetical protein n=1 Tax=Flavobacterium sp. N1719 TaxID=2885633 RepID=UPI0022232AF1|nr:hypothetical protein [Flavobacterium sp. N1719]
MHYPITYYIKTGAFLLQGIVLFCGYYYGISLLFTVSYVLSLLYSVAAFMAPILFPEKPKPNTLPIQRQTHHSVVSLSLVAGMALLFFTGFGRLFFENTYHVETITVFFSLVFITQAFEKPAATELRWENDGLLILGEKFSNTLPHGSITHFEIEEDAIIIHTQDGITHHIEHIIWDEKGQQEAQKFLTENLNV